MKLYIWEGDGISSAYHDDGTLVVLADSPEHAREVVRAERRALAAATRRRAPRYQAVQDKKDAFARANGGYKAELWKTPEGKALIAEQNAIEDKRVYIVPDGTNEALDRAPDRVVKLSKPCVVAFNGGGYD